MHRPLTLRRGTRYRYLAMSMINRMNSRSYLLDLLSGDASPALREEILRRDGRICHYCGGFAWEVDHLVPRRQGGLTIPSNLVAACGPCNRKKGNRTPVQWEAAKRRQAAQMATLRKPRLRRARRVRGRGRPYLAELFRASQS